jgi:hypothetical protein
MGFLATAVILLALQTAAPPVKASIEGVVVRAGTSEVIPRVRITIFRSDQPSGPIPDVVSDDQGRFIIKDLIAGMYSLQAERNGFGRQPYGQRRPGRGGVPLTVRTGERLKDVVFQLTPAGAIGGRVVDATGEPLLGVNIGILRAVYDENGKKTFTSITLVGQLLTRTDDRGEYRVFLLPPGRYYVQARPAPGLSNEPDVGYPITYYPGATESSGAVAIDLAPGEELHTIDFTLREQRLFRLRGRVIDPKTGRPPAAAYFELIPRNSPEQVSHSSPDYDPSDGSFVIGKVPAGSYWLQARETGFRSMAGARIGTGDQSSRAGRIAVEVGNTDIDNLVIAFDPDVSIAGRIVLDDGSPLESNPDVAKFVVRIQPKDSSNRSSPFPGRVKPDGTFTIENLQVGEYRVRLEPISTKYYLKSVRLGQMDVSNDLVIAGPVQDDLQLVVASDAGEINGTLVDQDRKPIGGAEVVVVPAQQGDRHGLSGYSVTNQNGQFGFCCIVPGEYKLFAWQDLESPNAFRDPDILRKYEELGTRVRVPAHGKQTIELKIIPTDQ